MTDPASSDQPPDPSHPSDLSALQDAYVDQLKRRGVVHTRLVEAAFRAVPRHLFVPGFPLDLDEVYSVCFALCLHDEPGRHRRAFGAAAHARGTQYSRLCTRRKIHVLCRRARAAKTVDPAGDVPMALTEMKMLDDLPLIPIREQAEFPRASFSLRVGRDKSIRAVQEARAHAGYLLLVAQRESAVDDPQPAVLPDCGTVAEIDLVEALPGGSLQVFVRNRGRARIVEYLQTA